MNAAEEISDIDSNENGDCQNVSENEDGDVKRERSSRRDEEEADGGSDGPERSQWVNGTEALTDHLTSREVTKQNLATKHLPQVLEIKCGGAKALLHMSKLGQGSRGPCIEYNDEWLTPNQFQMLAGRESSKDWKRSIRYRGQTIKWWLDRGLIHIHTARCGCTVCSVQQRATAATRKKMTTSDGPTVSTTPTTLAMPAVNATPVATTAATSDEDDIFNSFTIQQLESKEDSAAGVKLWSNATTSASFADENKAGPPDVGRVTRKRRYLAEKGLREAVPKCIPSSPHLNSVSTSLSIVEPTLWSGLQYHNTSNETPRISIPFTPTKRLAVSDDEVASTFPITCPEDDSIAHVIKIKEAHLPMDPEKWSVENVCMFIKKIGFAGYSCVFKENDVDGEALMMMREEHLLNTLRVKLGPALKLFKVIRKLQSL